VVPPGSDREMLDVSLSLSISVCMELWPY
jgi:hypothetical protein